VLVVRHTSALVTNDS